ncbi:MAG: hypothetical protein ACR2J5_06320, partial [Geodermatophilaceae bacterium]
MEHPGQRGPASTAAQVPRRKVRQRGAGDRRGGTGQGLGFPYEPAQVAVTLFTVGVPTLFLTMWARPQRPDPNLLGTL